MEHERCEESMQNVLDFNSIPHDAKKSSASSLSSIQTTKVSENQDSVNNFASPTPEKTIQASRRKNKGISLPVRELSKDFQIEDGVTKDDAVELSDGITEDELPDGINDNEVIELPDKYRTIADFFDRMDTSIRLLNLHKKLPTFQNICAVVEVLTKRKLSYNHLAQIKYMLPEAIQVEKIFIHVEKTLCVMPDLKVTLLLDAIDAHTCQSAFMALRGIFRARLLNFYNSHPEGCDIPEAMLPEPFSRGNHIDLQRPFPLESSIKSYSTSIENEGPLLVSSELSRSFKKHFSQKIIVPDTEKTKLLPSSVPLLHENSGYESNQDIKSPQQNECIRSPVELIFSPQCSINSNACESPPVKLVSVPQLMVETPAQPTPLKRPFLSSDDKVNTETGALSHSAAKKSLNFSILRGGESDSSFLADESKTFLGDDDVSASPFALAQMENKVHTMRQTGLVERKQILASLTELFNLIHRIFQSANSSLITKQELLQKIVANNLDIVETREAEEQLELLEELAPDWICRKLASSGDLLYSIKKVSNLESIHARLSEAV